MPDNHTKSFITIITVSPSRVNDPLCRVVQVEYRPVTGEVAKELEKHNFF